MSGITFLKRVTGATNNLVYLETSDTTATATAANYITNQAANILALNEGAFTWESNDCIMLSASDGISWCSINATFTTITSFAGTGSGDVTYTAPSIANHFAVYSNTTGNVTKDVATAINGGNIQAGLSGTAGALSSFPSTASKGSLKVAAVDNTGNTITTISNAAMGQASVVSIPDPAQATANFLISDSAGTQTINTGNLTLTAGNLAVTAGSVIATNGGVVQSGSSGHAGSLKVFPTTASKGDLKITCADQTGNTEVTLNASAMGQASVISLPDPAGATANVVLAPSALVSGNLVKASGTAGLIVDQGVAMKSVAQAAVAGGAADQTVTDAFCTTGSCVIASWNDTTNAAQIKTVAAGNGSFVVTSTADPGASHLNYVIFK